MRGLGTKENMDMKRSAALRLVEPAGPNADNGTKPPPRQRNEDRRPREHLSRDEVLALCKAAREQNRQGKRDAAAIWLAYNHGLRVSELCDLRWSDIQWQERRIMVRRLLARLRLPPELAALNVHPHMLRHAC